MQGHGGRRIRATGVCGSSIGKDSTTKQSGAGDQLSRSKALVVWNQDRALDHSTSPNMDQEKCQQPKSRDSGWGRSEVHLSHPWGGTATPFYVRREALEAPGLSSPRKPPLCGMPFLHPQAELSSFQRITTAPTHFFLACKPLPLGEGCPPQSPHCWLVFTHLPVANRA